MENSDYFLVPVNFLVHVAFTPSRILNDFQSCNLCTWVVNIANGMRPQKHMSKTGSKFTSFEKSSLLDLSEAVPWAPIYTTAYNVIALLQRVNPKCRPVVFISCLWDFFSETNNPWKAFVTVPGTKKVDRKC